MKYDFYVQTTQGMKNAIVESNFDFELGLFGFVPYRTNSSTTEGPEYIADFWRCVDEVLTSNGLTSEDYIRAVRALVDDKVYGEMIIR